MLNALKKDFAERFSDNKADKTTLYIAHADENELAEEFRQEVYEFFNLSPDKHEIKIQELSLSICTHVGPGTLALAAAQKYEA